MVRWRMLDCTAKQCKAELDLRDPLEEGKHKINGQLINGESNCGDRCMPRSLLVVLLTTTPAPTRVAGSFPHDVFAET